ncbi:MAG TPA: type II toxin-antitoxin system HicB family antitoxin [Candidatus Limnocylindria bacterium]|nr:type II toxin-antitoxin system HicB family antitoxin [Candidatus Limnocylindria bacterium]
MKRMYPIVLQAQADGGFLVTFPDVPACVAGGANWEEAYANAHDELSQCLLDLEDGREGMPVPTPGGDVFAREGDSVMLVSVDTSAFRRATEPRPLCRSVTMPRWMAEMARTRGYDVSRVLRDALTARFHPHPASSRPIPLRAHARKTGSMQVRALP